MENNFEKIDLTCPRCHATMEETKKISEDKTEITCPYCRYKTIIDEETPEELAEKARKISYARAEGTKSAQKATEKSLKSKKIKTIFICLLICYAIIALSTNTVNLSREYLEDPFEYIKINISGINEEGKLDIVVDNKIKNDIYYTVNKQKELSNGEVVRIKVNSAKYRFGKKEKEIKVTGLYNYLTSLDQLTDEMKEYIHKLTYDFEYNNITSSPTFSGELISLDRYKMYLETDGKNNNILYDTYIAKIKTKSGNIYEKYTAPFLKGIILINEPNDLLRYERLHHEGGIIKAGDPSSMGLGKDYVGNIVGFTRLNELEKFMKNNPDTTMKLYEE